MEVWIVVNYGDGCICAVCTELESAMKRLPEWINSDNITATQTFDPDIYAVKADGKPTYIYIERHMMEGEGK